jgi:hypothetical protein
LVSNEIALASSANDVFPHDTSSSELMTLTALPSSATFPAAA